MPASVEAVFSITNRSRPALTEIKTDTKAATDAQKKLGEQTDVTAKRVRVNSDQMAGAIKKATKSATSDIDKVKRSLEILGKIRANPKVDIDTAAAEAKIRVLKKELNSLETKKAQSELAALGVIADKTATSLAGGGSGGGVSPPTSIGAAGGGAASSAGGVAGAAESVSIKTAAMGAAIALALPAVVSLAGSLSALAGSAAAAAGGAGALGVAGLGAVAIGLGSIAAVAKPAITAITEAKKAQDAYNKAVQQYGDKSAQAVKAHQALLAEFKKTPGSQQLLGGLTRLQSSWKTQTAPAQGDFIGAMVDGLKTLNRLLPEFAQISNSSMAAARSSWQTVLGVLSSPEARQTYMVLGETFKEIAGPAGNAFGNVAIFFERIARAATPEVKQVFQGLENLTNKMAGGVGNGFKTQSVIAGMVSQLGSWVKMLGAAGKLAAAFFGAGATQGQSLVNSITDQLDRWTTWLKDNPAKVQHFFDEAVSSTKALASSLGTIATALFQISTALMPVLAAVASLGGSASSNLVGGLATYAGLRSAGGMVAGRGAAKGAASVAASGGSSAVAGAAESAGAAALLSGGVRGAATKIGGAALRKAWPVAVAMGLWDFGTAGGSLGNRLGSAANGTLLGIPNMLGAHLGKGGPPDLNGQQLASMYLQRGSHQNAGSIFNQMGRLQGQLAATRTVVDPATGASVNTHVHVIVDPSERKRLQDQINALAPQLKIAVGARAASQAGGFQEAFGIREQGLGENAARKGLFSGLDTQLKSLGGRGKTALLQAMSSWQGVLEAGTAKQKNTAKELADYIEGRFKKMGKNVEVVNGQILTGSTDEWASIRTAMSGEAEKAREEVSSSFTAIQQQAVGSLMAMGYSRGQADHLVRGTESGSATARRNIAAGPIPAGNGTVNTASQNANNQVRGRALGGRINGVGNADYVNLGGGAVGAPGELVVNRHSERKIDQKLGRSGALASLVSGEHTPHNMNVSPMAGIMPGLALGGRLALGGMTMDVQRGGSQKAAQTALAGGMGPMLAAAGQIDSQHFPYSWGGGHNPGFRGPYDCSGAVSAILHAGGYLSSPVTASQLMTMGEPGPGAVSIYANPAHAYMALGNRWFGTSTQNPGGGAGFFAGGPRPGFVVRHFGAGGSAPMASPGFAGGGGGGVAVPQLRRRRSGLGGVPGALSQAAMDSMTAGAQGILDGAGGGGGVGGVGDVSGPSGVRAMVVAGLRLAGVPATPGNVAAQMRLTMGESGGRNVAQAITDVNSSNGSGGAKGVAQMIQSSFDAYALPGHSNIWNTTDNEAASIRYQMAKYGRLVGHAGYALGGRLPGVMQMGDGGVFSTSTPTMMQVGERGQRETVTVRRESAGAGQTGHGGDVIVKIGRIDYRNDGDIEKKVKEEFARAARAIRNAPIGGEGEL